MLSTIVIFTPRYCNNDGRRDNVRVECITRRNLDEGRLDRFKRSRGLFFFVPIDVVDASILVGQREKKL